MGEQSTVEWNRLRLSFFDQFLKGIDTGCYDDSWAKMFIMGGGDGTAVDVGREELPLNNYARWSSEPATSGRRMKINHGGRWIEAPGWPVEPVAPTPFYLHAGGGLSTVAPADAAAPSRYEFDPRNSCPQIGGDWTHRRQFAGNPGLVSAEDGTQFAAPGPRDQVARRNWFGCTDDMPLWTRPDVLTFSTDPLDEAVEVVGNMRVVLYASSSAVDTDFTFKLIDEYPPNPDYPNGFAMLIHDGIVRARYRDSFEREELMEPGTVYRFDVDFWATANGSRPATASAWSSRAATSRRSTSIPTPASRSAGTPTWSSRSTASTTMPNTRATSCSRSIAADRTPAALRPGEPPAHATSVEVDGGFDRGASTWSGHDGACQTAPHMIGLRSSA